MGEEVFISYETRAPLRRGQLSLYTETEQDPPRAFLLESTVESILRAFLAEDIGFGDITTDALVRHDIQATGYVVCKEPCVIAGIREARVLFQIVGCETTRAARDGEMVKAGTRILYTNGPAHNLLKVERVLLNLLSHMSGVATATQELVRLAEKSDGHVRIACTRKTLPGLRISRREQSNWGAGILIG